MTRTTAPTLEDVARMAGVSTASISRALNDPDKVAKPTRDKIEKAIDVLGYTPNFGGRALASNRTNTVGAIIPSMANAMFASGVQAFQEVLSEAGVNLLLASTGYDPDQELRQIKALANLLDLQPFTPRFQAIMKPLQRPDIVRMNARP